MTRRWLAMAGLGLLMLGSVPAMAQQPRSDFSVPEYPVDATAASQDHPFAGLSAMGMPLPAPRASPPASQAPPGPAVAQSTKWVMYNTITEVCDIPVNPDTFIGLLHKMYGDVKVQRFTNPTNGQYMVPR